MEGGRDVLRRRVCCSSGANVCADCGVRLSLHVTMSKEEEASAEDTNAMVVEKPDAAVAVLAFEDDDDDDELYGDLGNFSGIEFKTTSAESEDVETATTASKAADGGTETVGSTDTAIQDIDASDSDSDGEGGEIQIIIGDASAKKKSAKKFLRMTKTTWRRSSLEGASQDGATDPKATPADTGKEDVTALDPGTGITVTTTSTSSKATKWTGLKGAEAPPEGYDPRFYVDPSRCKTAFDLNLDNEEEKGWLHEGADISDYFNYGLDEQSWHVYAKEQRQVRFNILYKEWVEKRAALDAAEAEAAAAAPPAPQSTEQKDSMAVSTTPPRNDGRVQNPSSTFVDVDQRKCYKCGNIGHMANACPNPQAETGPEERACFNCNEFGHMAKDCPQGMRCYRCQGFGHFAKDCANAPVERERGGFDRGGNEYGRDRGGNDYGRDRGGNDYGRDRGGYDRRGGGRYPDDRRGGYDRRGGGRYPDDRRGGSRFQGRRGGWGDRRDRSRSRSPPHGWRGDRRGNRSPVEYGDRERGSRSRSSARWQDA